MPRPRLSSLTDELKSFPHPVHGMRSIERYRSSGFFVRALLRQTALQNLAGRMLASHQRTKKGSPQYPQRLNLQPVRRKDNRHLGLGSGYVGLRSRARRAWQRSAGSLYVPDPFREVQWLTKRSRSNPRDAALLRLGLCEDRHFAQAEPYLRAACEFVPTAQSLHWLGVCLLEQDRAPESTPYFERAMAMLRDEMFSLTSNYAKALGEVGRSTSTGIAHAPECAGTRQPACALQSRARCCK